MEYIVSMKDIKKYEILQQLINKQIKGYQAASFLGYSQVHISRLKQKVLKYGFEGILRPKKESPRKLKESFKEQIANLYKTLYYDFNIMHFKDKLEENHNIKLSYEKIRQILIEYRLHKPKKKKKVYRRRRRMPKAGMLIQMDASQHKWIPSIDKPWHLIATIDDATSEVLFAKFYPYEGVFACMEVIRKTIENKGIFYCLYVDKASHFKTTRYGGLHVNIDSEQEDTQIERALKELDINIIPANSPQAKGRIERLFRTFQDRLIKEMRLRDIKDYKHANLLLEKEYIAYHNKRFAHKRGS
jgi:regulator of replication initiation timing